MRETSAPVLPIVENERVAGLLVGEARDRRFVAIDRRFTLLDGSRFRAPIRRAMPSGASPVW